MALLVTESHELTARPPRSLSVGVATGAKEIEAAQRLRYRVFAGEMHARLKGGAPGRDQDRFDPWCEHLVVRDDARGAVVGTYRILTGERAMRLGAFYAETEFDLGRLRRFGPSLCEIGRACVDADYRDGAVVMLLWQGIARFMRERGLNYLIGCASIGMEDGGTSARRIWSQVANSHLAPIEYRVFPRRPLMLRGAQPLVDEVDATACVVPSLLGAYLRFGAWVGGEPAFDSDFNTADLFVMLPLARVDSRHARHFLRPRPRASADANRAHLQEVAA